MFAPPAQALPHIFQPTSANTAHMNTPIKASTSTIIHPRRKLWHKRFTYHLTITHPGLRRKGLRFRNPAKLKRENAVAALMNSELLPVEADGMTDDDRIFLMQLEELRLDQLRMHTLGDAREIVAHAKALGPRRVLEHTKRDRQVSMRLEENARRKKEDEEFCRLEELWLQREERQRQEEEKRRQAEEIAGALARMLTHMMAEEIQKETGL